MALGVLLSRPGEPKHLVAGDDAVDDGLGRLALLGVESRDRPKLEAEANKLVAYLAVTSRLLEQPLAVVVQSTSAAGKSVLLNAVLAFVPRRSASSTGR